MVAQHMYFKGIFVRRFVMTNVAAVVAGPVAWAHIAIVRFGAFLVKEETTDRTVRNRVFWPDYFSTFMAFKARHMHHQDMVFKDNVFSSGEWALFTFKQLLIKL